MISTFVFAWAIPWWLPPVGITVLVCGAIYLVVRMIIVPGKPGPSGISLSFSGPATVNNGSWSQPPFTLTVTSTDPKNNPVGGRTIIFTVTALNPPPGTPYDFCRIVQASDPSGILVTQQFTPSIYSLKTTAAGTAQIVVQPDGMGMVTIIANDIMAKETQHINFESV